MMEITINQNDSQLIRLENNNIQTIDINQDENQNININNTLPQDLELEQNQNQIILIDDGGNINGISDVLVNGISVVAGNIAYVIVPTKTSELENNSGFITNETDPTVPYYVKEISINDINNWNNKQNELISGSTIKTINNTSLLGSGNINIEGTIYSAGTGININSSNVISNTITNYNQLEDLPTIPSKTSDLTNDNDFVSSDELSDVAFTGSYADLSNTPEIPDKTSDLTNDSGFIDTTDLSTALSSKQDTLVSGTNIKTINNDSILGSGNISISGGTPTDVQINGTSITSSNVANIITQSTYNSSTNKIATKSDIPTLMSQLSMDYNSSETVIGTWINNKPIYRKIFTGSIAHNDVLLSNIDILLNGYGSGLVSNRYRLLGFSLYANNQRYDFAVNKNTSNQVVAEIYSAGATTTATGCNVVLEYTKTTD